VVKYLLLSIFLAVSTPLFAMSVAFTFDDGPKPHETREILAILDRYKAKATFFVVGRDVQIHPEIVQLIAKKGHELGNHSFSHLRLNELSDAQIFLELQATQALVAESTGKFPAFFRPPGGQMDGRVEKAAKSLKMAFGYWTVNSGDFEVGADNGIPLSEAVMQEKANRMAQSILASLKSNSVILLHNGNPITIKALPILLEKCAKQGITWVTLSQLGSSHVLL
jgi:peptidoglycan/xylan/chitin deacetylase (PgdA/CDA1 family)